VAQATVINVQVQNRDATMDQTLGRGDPIQPRLLVLLPAASKETNVPASTAPARVMDLDARFESGGAWSGVAALAEMAYHELSAAGHSAIVAQHLIELHAVLLDHRDGIAPTFQCLTDTASADEKTRFYAVDRAYRLVHGLIGLVLQWKQALFAEEHWGVVVRGFDQAQHLGTRFFGELARRAASDGRLAVVIETSEDDAQLARRLPDLTAFPAVWIDPDWRRPATRHDLGELDVDALATLLENASDLVFEREYPALLVHYRSAGDGLAAARIALRIFMIYNSFGYYHEARSFIDLILPHFDQLVADNETRRIHFVSRMNICLVQTEDLAGALRVVDELAGSYLTKPHLVAAMNYILGMHHLRYARTMDIDRAERHILLAVEKVCEAKDYPETHEYPFQKVFIDNGLAFLRARQGRHQEALDLCQAGYEFLTREMGEDRHMLHRSVLLYNIAQVYVMLDRRQEGIEYYRRAIQMDPNYSEYHNELGNILQDEDAYEEAIAHYETAIRCSAPYPEVYFNKGACHARLGMLEEALEALSTSLELNKQQPQAHALRADVLRELGQDDAALIGYDAAIALGCTATAVRVNRAVLHYNAGAYALALADMDDVIASEPDESSHYENRAAIYKALEQDDLYAADISRAEQYRLAA
jgi:tetratricopeptide (TPR) repeat protein